MQGNSRLDLIIFYVPPTPIFCESAEVLFAGCFILWHSDYFRNEWISSIVKQQFLLLDNRLLDRQKFYDTQDVLSLSLLHILLKITKDKESMLKMDYSLI